VSLRPIAALLTVVALHPLASSVSGQTNVVSDQKVITDARAAYYNLTRHGFYGFHATIEPNWKVILADTATPENLKVFRSQCFSMTVDARGAVTVNRAFGEMQSTRLAPAVKQIHNNVQRLVESFFGNWAFFMIGSPFPELQIRVERLDNDYRFFYTVQSTEVRLKMTPDFLITESQLSDSTTRRTVKPVFQKTSEGFLLRGYHTVFEPSQGNKTTIDTTIEYHDVGGMKLPSKIHIKGMYGAEPVEAELKFNAYALISPSSH
jgi:hypothetical protein